MSLKRSEMQEPTGTDKSSLSRKLNRRLAEFLKAPDEEIWGIDWTFLSKRQIREAIRRVVK